MKFNAAVLLAGASAASATFNQNVDSISSSLAGLHNAIDAYTIPDYYAAKSINSACSDVNALIGDAIKIAEDVGELAEDVAEDVVKSLHVVLSQAKAVTSLVEKTAEILLEPVEELGESAAHFVVGSFLNIEHGALGFVDATVGIIGQTLAAEAKLIGKDFVGAFHDIVEIL
jgi:hypothetical protein